MNEPALPPELHKEELAMTRFTGVLSAVFLLELAVPASAHFGFLFRPRPAVAYYYAVPVAEFCVTPPVIWVPVSVDNPPARPYAQPQPAPASTGKEPPLAEPGQSPKPEPKRPQVQLSNYYDSYAVAPSGEKQSPTKLCSVSFWNLADHGLVLKVGEQRVTLARGRSVTFDLDRQFTWLIEGRETQTSQVAAKDAGLEIVIRR
jgi:hypothetical protein